MDVQLQALNLTLHLDEWLVLRPGRFTHGKRGASTQPPVQWEPWALFLEVKRPGREADHSSPSSVVKNAWSYTSTPPIRLHGVVLS